MQKTETSSTFAASRDLERVIFVSSHIMTFELLGSFLNLGKGVHFESVSSLEGLNGLLQRIELAALIVIDTDSFPEIEHKQIAEVIESLGHCKICLFVDPVAVSRNYVWLDRGVAGILHKSMPIRRIENALRFLLSGEQYIPYSVPVNRTVTAPGGEIELTELETSILRLLSEGHGNRDISKSLGKAEVTVKGYLVKLFKKLSVKNRTSAVLVARSSGIV